MWSGAGVLQMSCPLIEEDGLLTLEMLDAVEKEAMAPTPGSAPYYPAPDPEEEKQVALIPEESCASSPEQAAHSEGGLGLIQGRYPAIPHGFAHLQAN